MGMGIEEEIEAHDAAERARIEQGWREGIFAQHESTGFIEWYRSKHGNENETRNDEEANFRLHAEVAALGQALEISLGRAGTD